MGRDINPTLFEHGFINESTLFKRMFSHNALVFAYREKFKNSQAKGVDRINGFQYLSRSSLELEKVSQKCLDGSFRFSPFLEKLKLKGRGKHPRVIGIPTIRDRIVLHQIHKYLAIVFPDTVPRNVASTYVRAVAEDMAELDVSKTLICCTDIEKFYDSIQQPRLIRLLKKKITCEPAISLISHALQTPTIPKNTRRTQYSSYRQDLGVPQGLAISNILAAIYMAEVDDVMRAIPGITYYRYVDDVLMYGDPDTITSAYISLRGRLRTRGLTLHGRNSDKTYIGRIDKKFSYLGYEFRLPKITVRDSTFERFLQTIAAKVSDFKHNYSRRLEKHKYLNKERLVEIFFLELNEKITGALSGNKRYGWIAYFNQITDERLLHQMDQAILRMVSRVPALIEGGSPPLKKLVRAHFEMKFSPRAGYIRDYDLNVSIAQKLRFLEIRGRVDPATVAADRKLTQFRPLC